MSALVRMAKSNQGIVLALTAVVAGVVVGYSLLIGNTPANPSKRKVRDRFCLVFSRLLALTYPLFFIMIKNMSTLILKHLAIDDAHSIFMIF